MAAKRDLKLDQIDMEKLVEKGMTIRELAGHFDCAKTTVRYWLKKYGLQTRNGVTHPRNFGLVRRCSCGETDPDKFYGNKVRTCAKCHNRENLERGHQKKIQIIEYLGGCCTRCGFDHPAALDVHHTDPALKDPNWQGWRGWNWERIKAEIQSCVLLCRNCHSITHYEWNHTD